MTTIRKIEANRRNAQKSTGPKTPEGKAAVARNALKHGLLSRNPVLPGEDPRGEFPELVESLHQYYAPENPVDANLVEDLAGVMWKLRRAERIQSGIYNTAGPAATAHVWGRTDEPTPEEQEEVGELILAHVFETKAQSLDRIERHEANLRRAQDRLIKRLDARRQAPMPEPAEQTPDDDSDPQVPSNQNPSTENPVPITITRPAPEEKTPPKSA